MLTVAGFAVAGLPAMAESAGHVERAQRGKVVVANRNDGTISVIDTHTDDVILTELLPDGSNTPEPMYVYYDLSNRRFFVGDRANDRVVAYDARSLEVVGTTPVGAGVFHMWGNPGTGQLWVNGDIDNTTTIVDMNSLAVLGVADTPADLVADGGFPHDVIVGAGGDLAYVSVLGLPGDNDYVVQYDTATFEEVGRAAVGKDPHLSLAARNPQDPHLYVPCQGTAEVIVLDRFTLDTLASIPVPGAHGAGIASNGKYFYTTNISGGGGEALWAIDTATLSVVDDPVDAPYDTPHNIALTRNNRKFYITHSGSTNDKVSIYQRNGSSAVPLLVGEVTTGLNPFGLAFVR